MAYVPTFSENLSFLNGERDTPEGNVVQLTGGVPAAGGSGGGGGGASLSPTTTGPQAAQRPADVGQPAGFSSNLFEPIRTGVATGTQQLGGAYDAFRSAAGPSRTFEGIGGTNILDASVATGGDLNRAKGLVGAQYGGPQGIDEQTVSDLQSSLGSLQARTAGLGSGTGLSTILQESSPGLTRGSALFEARNRIQDPEYRRQQQESIQQVREFASQLRQQREAAEGFATQRGGEERGIAEQSRSYLLGKQGGVAGEIDARVAHEREQQARVAEQVRQFQLTGDTEQLAPASSAFTGGFQLADFNTQARQTARSSEDRWDAIMDEYADIKHIAPFELSTDTHGRERQDRFSPDWLKANASNYSPQQIEALRKRVFERQQLLQKDFNVPSSGNRERGQFSLFNPLHFGDREQPVLPDTRGFVLFDPGLSPTRENVSTEEQRGIFNRISEALDSLESIETSGEVYRAAQIGADIDGYLAAEETALAQRGEQLDNRAATWNQQVRHLRKKYKAAQKKAKWGKIGRVLGAVGTFGLSELQQAIEPENNLAVSGLANLMG